MAAATQIAGMRELQGQSVQLQVHLVTVSSLEQEIKGIDKEIREVRSIARAAPDLFGCFVDPGANLGLVPVSRSNLRVV